MIKLKNISFGYNKKSVITDFSLSIAKNDRICLFGESGAGKTTLLRLILGLEKPTKGEIQKTNGIKPSVVFQENRLLPFKTVLENITLIGATEKTALIHLSALGLADWAFKKPDELSGGMKRRVAIARALSADYDYLVLDEPFAGLDSENIALCTEYISKSIGDKALVLVTHSLEEAKLLSAKQIILKKTI